MSKKGVKTGFVPKTAFRKGNIPWNKGIKTGYKPWTTGLKAKDNPKLAKILEMAHKATRGKPSWNKGKKASLEARKKMSLFRKGKPRIGNPQNWRHSEETKEKLSLSHKGQIAWNKDLKGYNAGEKHPFYGKKRPEITGEKNNKWKGGITPINKLQRAVFAQKYRKIIFKRDNYTCQLCGIRGVILQVDHIQEWSEYIEGRFALENCRTLCQQCHYKITFGKPMPQEAKKWGNCKEWRWLLR